MGTGLQDRQEDSEEAMVVLLVKMGSFYGLTRIASWGPTHGRMC